MTVEEHPFVFKRVGFSVDPVRNVAVGV